MALLDAGQLLYLMLVNCFTSCWSGSNGLGFPQREPNMARLVYSGQTGKAAQPSVAEELTVKPSFVLI